MTLNILFIVFPAKIITLKLQMLLIAGMHLLKDERSTIPAGVYVNYQD